MCDGEVIVGECERLFCDRLLRTTEVSRLNMLDDRRGMLNSMCIELCYVTSTNEYGRKFKDFKSEIL